jgi:hypothetical protein
MAQSSDEIIKREIMETFGHKMGDLHLRIFPESSNDDQVLFTEGGLTFSKDGVDYGSCDAGWFVRRDGKDIPFIGLEGTDALNRKSSGNAQYQRFHHALGAVKNGLIGVYYLKKGIDKIQEDLFGMAVTASKYEAGTYLIIDDLEDLRPILENYKNPTELKKQFDIILNKMNEKHLVKFNSQYDGSWEKFAEKRSTIILQDRIIKYAGRMKRNFIDGSQRAGHIAVGEMYLTKYFFYGQPINYLMLKMTGEDVAYLDEHKADDKEWYLLRHEPNVELKTIDDIFGLDNNVRDKLLSIKNEPIKSVAFQIYKKCVEHIDKGLRNGSLIVM